MRRVDANTGGAACQLQAIKLYELLHSPELQDEAANLLEDLRKIKKMVHLRGSNLKNEQELSTVKFFDATLLSLKVSEEMLYLIRARMLTVTKVPSHIEENGVLVTKTDPGQLSKLSSSLQQVFSGAYVSTFVALNAKHLCQQSIEKIQTIAANLKTEDPLTVEMLSVSHLVHYMPEKMVVDKPFSCLFFQMRALLQHLKEQKILIAIKSVEKNKETPKYLCLKAIDGDFEFLKKEETQTLDPETALIVFEGVVADLNELEKLIKTIGFEKLILICSAQEPQYHPKSTLEDMQHDTAKKMVEQTKELAKEMGLEKIKDPLFLLDHVFCNAVKYENIGLKL